MILTEEKKKIIEAEEAYRHQIAQKLHAELQSAEQTAASLEKTIWDKTFEILNSSFGLWLLSSVFISGGAAIYQIANHQYVEKMNVQKEMLGCEFELANRLNAMKYLVQKSKTMADTQLALTPISKSLGAISPEYEHASIAVLYFKSYQLSGVRNKIVEEYVKELEEMNLAIQQANPKSQLDKLDKEKLLNLIGYLQQYEIDKIDGRTK